MWREWMKTTKDGTWREWMKTTYQGWHGWHQGWREWMKTTYQGWHVERMDEDHLPRMARGENG